MIPFQPIAPWQPVPGVVVAPFGLLVTLGVFAGMAYVGSRRERTGLTPGELAACLAWSVGPGFLAAHVLDAALYFPEAWRADPWLPLRAGSGMSSYGGFFGAFVGGAAYLRWGAKRAFLPVADVFTEGLVIGWVFGRLGCTLSFDHPGRPSTFALAFDHPVLGPRHNLGFEELLFTAAVLVPLVVRLSRAGAPAGTSVAWLTLAYAPARFLLDFLRAVDLPASDARYAGLTPAQWACLGVTALAALLLRRVRGARRSTDPDASI